MTKTTDSKNIDPTLPQKDAVKHLRERFNNRKSEIRPSSEMDEIMRNEPAKKKVPTQKIAKPTRTSDADLL